MTASGPRRLLAVDVGNSRVHLARFEDDRLVARVDTPARAEVLPETCTRLLPEVTAIVVASVNPPAAERVCAWLRTRAHLIPRELRGGDVPLRNLSEEPARVGIDRLLNAYGAWRLAGGGCVVASLGSAITVDAVNRAGEFLGGAILPGLTLGLTALHEHCAQLPPLTPETPTRALGRNTREAMQAGVVLGAVGAIRHLCERIRAEAGEPLAGYLTGGDADCVSTLWPEGGRVMPDLTLTALRMCAVALHVHP